MRRLLGGGGDTQFVRPNVSHCIEENEVHYNPIIHDYSKDYLTFVALGNTTFSFTNTISYSSDNGQNWTEGNSVTVNGGDKVLWKGELTPFSNNGIGTFSSTGQFDVQGNIMSLLYGDDFDGQTDLTGKNYAFYNLFRGNDKLINAKNLILPATTLATQCYEYMFGECENLISAPVLPAETMARECYYGMFYYCESLKTAPELPATTLANYCYGYMFCGCSSLTIVPTTLPAETLAQYCYYWMFDRCTSLTTAPTLPATTLATQCYYNMFNGCTSLTTVQSELPATTLENSCYYRMFHYCSNLTTAPILPAATLVDSCYYDMFRGCTSLNSITCLATTISASNCTTNWVYDVPSGGTFTKADGASWSTGTSGIPSGWTVETATE